MVDRSEYVIDHAIAEGMEGLMADTVRKYPIIYEKVSKLKSGSNYDERCDAAWSKISDELNLELESCKSLWSGMKQKFIKHRKKLDNGEVVPNWPTYHLLHWLDRHVKKRKSRHDYIKQMKITPKTFAKPEPNEDEESNEQDEEWAETATVQVKLKRRAEIMSSSDGLPLPKTLCRSNGFESKRKFNIEVVSDSYDDRELFNETVDQKTTIKDAEIIVLEENRAKQSTPQIEIIDVKETMKCSDTDENLLKIERFLSNCAHTIDRLNVENTASDSNDAFGKYIASMVREVPAHKRMKVRLNILQYASELIANETSLSTN